MNVSSSSATRGARATPIRGRLLSLRLSVDRCQLDGLIVMKAAFGQNGLEQAIETDHVIRNGDAFGMVRRRQLDAPQPRTIAKDEPAPPQNSSDGPIRQEL